MGGDGSVGRRSCWEGVEGPCVIYRGTATGSGGAGGENFYVRGSERREGTAQGLLARDTWGGEVRMVLGSGQGGVGGGGTLERDCAECEGSGGMWGGRWEMGWTVDLDVGWSRGQGRSLVVSEALRSELGRCGRG
jgi:hypothetical protein